MIPPLGGWPTKANETTSPHEVRMSRLDTNPVFQSLEGKTVKVAKNWLKDKSFRDFRKKRVSAINTLNTLNFNHYYFTQSLTKCDIVSVSGVQLEIFQVRGCFMELGHFYKLFVK